MANTNNAAALRKALKYARDVLAFTCRIDWRTTMAWGELHDAIHKADSALAAPPRNCDVGTAEEQVTQFEAFCHGRPNCHCCEIRKLHNKCGFPFCALAWAQMPFAPAEGKEASNG